MIDLRDEQTLIAARGQSSTKTITKPNSGKSLGGSSKAASLRAKKAESVQSIVESTTNHPTIPSPSHSIVEEKGDVSQTAAMPSPMEAMTPSNSSVASPADNLFLQWARGDGEAAAAVDESNQSSSQKAMATDGTSSSSPVTNPADNDFLKWARGEEGPKDAGTFIAPKSVEKQPRIAKESTPSSPSIDDALRRQIGDTVGCAKARTTPQYHMLCGPLLYWALQEGHPQSPLKVSCKKIAMLRNAVRIRSEIIGPSD